MGHATSKSRMMMMIIIIITTTFSYTSTSRKQLPGFCFSSLPSPQSRPGLSRWRPCRLQEPNPAALTSGWVTPPASESVYTVWELRGPEACTWQLKLGSPARGCLDLKKTLSDLHPKTPSSTSGRAFMCNTRRLNNKANM